MRSPHSLPVALTGFLTSGLVNTLIDTPRFVFLLLLLVWLCGSDDADRARRKQVGSGELR